MLLTKTRTWPKNGYRGKLDRERGKIILELSRGIVGQIPRF